MFRLDLEEISKLSLSMKYFSGPGKSALYRFLETDHLPGPEGSLKDRVKFFVSELALKQKLDSELASKIAGIQLLSNVRFLDYVFNPISIFFCFDENEEPLCALIEVGNTFYEKKPYLVPLTENGHYESKQKKHFYVSPFSELDQYFHFQIRTNGDKLHVCIRTEDDDGIVLSATLAGEPMPLSDTNLIKLTMRYPLVTLHTIALIHWHAFLLWMKKIPYFRKEDSPQLQTGVLNRRATESKALHTSEVT